MRVLSLFDGHAGCYCALKEVGITSSVYYASEINKWSMAIAKYNFPDIKHIGDVRFVSAPHLGEIDLLAGGSPCTSFSFSGKNNGMTTKCNEEILTLNRYMDLKVHDFQFEGDSYLFWEYIRLLKQVDPKYFFLENVQMSNKWRDVISDTLNVEPIMIDSALVSAAHRKRNYWTNIPGVCQPEDRGILLKDILESGFSDRDKSLTLTASYSNKPMLSDYTDRKIKQLVIDNQVIPVIKRDNNLIIKSDKSQCIDANYYKGPDNHGQRTILIGMADRKGFKQNNKVYCASGKSPALLQSSGENSHPKITLDNLHWRRLSVIECERLQTHKDGYTEFGIFPNSKTKKISTSQRIKTLGNGWNIATVAHLFKGLTNE